jgi:flagellar hook-associated protein 1 FlgK
MSIRSLNTGYSALTAARVGIETASNNIANANTEGYTRQRVNFAPTLPTSFTFGQIGNGVEVVDISRTRDAFLDERVRSSSASVEALQTRTDLLGRAEAALGEPDYGVSAQLDSLWDSFEELALDPTSRGNQVEVLHRLEAVAARIVQINTEVNAIGDTTRAALASRLEEANALAARVAELNEAITQAGFNGTPNDLLDRRDLAVDQLVELTGAKARLDDDGNYHVSVSGLSLVLGLDSNTLSFDPSTDTITHDASGAAVTLGGVVGGQQQFLVEDVPAILAGLGDLTSDLADAVNAQHALGFSGPGTPGTDLFTYNPVDPSGTIAVAITDPSEIAASDTDAVPYPVHNGENAQRLSELRVTLVAAAGTQSLADMARELVAEVGTRVSAARDSAASQQDLASAARLARETETGVSLDEEMVELMRYQQAYAAAARVITTADSALDVLVNRTGLVGR